MLIYLTRNNPPRVFGGDKPDKIRPLIYHLVPPTLGIYSLNSKTSYRQISKPQSLEAGRLSVTMIVLLWNLTGSSAAEAIVKFESDWKI